MTMVAVVRERVETRSTALLNRSMGRIKYRIHRESSSCVRVPDSQNVIPTFNRFARGDYYVRQVSSGDFICIYNSPLHGVFATKKDSLLDYLLHTFDGDRELPPNEEINQRRTRDRVTYFLGENNLSGILFKVPKINLV